MAHTKFTPTARAFAAAVACSGAVAQTPPQPAATPASAPQPEAFQQLETVTVSVTRTPTALTETPASVSVIEGAKLEKQLAVSSEAWDAMVKFVPGLEANTGTSAGNDGKGPLLRGRAASVLINGVSVNSLLRGTGFVLGQMDSDAIDRIEANRGATAAFGFGAPGGLISLQSRRGETREAEIVFRTSLSANTGKLGEGLSPKVYAGVGQKKDGWDYYIGGAVAREKPKFSPDGTATFSQDVNSYNIDATVGLALGAKGRFEVSTNLYSRAYNADYLPGAYYKGYCIGNDFDNCPLGGANVNEAARLDDELSSAQYHRVGIVIAKLTQEVFGQSLDAAVYGMRKSYQFSFPYSSLEDPPAFGAVREPSEGDRVGLRSSLTKRFGEGAEAPSLTYGVDLQRDEVFIRSFESGDYPGTPLEETRPSSPPVRLDSSALFVQGKVNFGELVLSAGARAERFKPRSLGYSVAGFVIPEGSLPDFKANSYNAGAVYKLSRRSEVYASMSQGLEISELGRLLRDGTAGGGVPTDLSRIKGRPVKTTQYELGWRSRAGDLRWDAAVYYVDAPLAALLDCSGDPGEPCVVTRQPEKTWGVEGTMDWRVNDAWSLGGNFAWQNGSYVDENGVKRRQTNTRLTPPRLNAFANWRPAEGWETSLSVTKIFDRKPFEDQPARPFGLFGPDGAFVGNVKGYTLVDLSAAREVGEDGVVSVGIANLFDKRYIPAGQQAFGDLFYQTYGDGRRITLKYAARF